MRNCASGVWSFGPSRNDHLTYLHWMPAAAEHDELTISQFNTRLVSGLSSEKVGTSISKRSPFSLIIW